MSPRPIASIASTAVNAVKSCAVERPAPAARRHRGSASAPAAADTFDRKYRRETLLLMDIRASLHGQWRCRYTAMLTARLRREQRAAAADVAARAPQRLQTPSRPSCR